MIRLLKDLGFILRNWRYFHAHHALWAELRDWLVDYEPPQEEPKPTVNYSITVNSNAATVGEIQRRSFQSASEMLSRYM